MRSTAGSFLGELRAWVANVVVLAAALLFVFLLASPHPLDSSRIFATGAFAALLVALFVPEWRAARARLGELPFSRVLAALVGAAGGSLMGLVLGVPLVESGRGDGSVPYAVTLVIAFATIGGIVGAGYFSQWRDLVGAGARGVSSPLESYLLDSSALIDGRIGDLIERRLLVGNFYVPEFVLVELQQVADNKNRRERGRRGLAVVRRLQESGHVSIKDLDKPNLVGADAKLCALAKEMGVTLVTNDNPLKQLASAQDVEVLSINDLASALRRETLIGDELEVNVLGKGTGAGQGIAQLSDGARLVIEGAGDLAGQRVRVRVARVINDPSGRKLYFGTLVRAIAASETLRVV